MKGGARHSRAPIKVSLLVAAFMGLLYLTGFLKPAEWRAYDLRLWLVAGDTPDPRIVMVAIDDESLGAIGRWPWPRETHARLIQALGAVGARVIAFDVEFPEASPDPRSDEQFGQAAREAGNVVVGSQGQVEAVGEPGLVRASRFLDPVDAIRSTTTVGHMNVLPGPDGVIRSNLAAVATDGEVVPSLALAAAARYVGAEPPLWDGRSSAVNLAGRSIPLDAQGRFLINFSGEARVFPMVSYADVLNGTADPSLFKDRIVLVGYWAQTMGDLRNFPVLGPLNPGVMAHAYGIQTILDGAFITQAPRAANLLAILLLTFLTGLIFFRVSPARGAILLAVILAAFALINVVYLLGVARMLVDLVHPALGLGLSYLGALGLRIVTEQRDRLRVTDMFQRYVGPQVVKEILSTGEDALRLGGSRRPLTVFFLDVRGFTPLAEKLQPEDVVEILNRNFEMITQVIFKYGGTLDKFIGDAVMAVFNAPLNLPDHALQAVLAAREIQGRAVEIRKGLEARYGSSVQFGIGINTGEAVVGNIGSSTRMEYTAIGDAVNLAARLESNAKPGQILISESTCRALDGRVETEPVGPLVVKGKSEPVMAHLVSLPAEQAAVPGAAS